MNKKEAHLSWTDEQIQRLFYECNLCGEFSSKVLWGGGRITCPNCNQIQESPAELKKHEQHDCPDDGCASRQLHKVLHGPGKDHKWTHFSIRNIAIDIMLRFDEDAKVWVGWCPALDVFSQGEDKDQAEEATRDAVLLTVKYAENT